MSAALVVLLSKLALRQAQGERVEASPRAVCDRRSDEWFSLDGAVRVRLRRIRRAPRRASATAASGCDESSPWQPRVDSRRHGDLSIALRRLSWPPAHGLSPPRSV